MLNSKQYCFLQEVSKTKLLVASLLVAATGFVYYSYFDVCEGKQIHIFYMLNKISLHVASKIAKILV